MKGPARRKCLCCKEFYRPDRRNLRYQRYCSKASCRKESKAQSQLLLQQRPENQNYFRGPENSRRVKEWRKRHLGYWRKQPSAPEGPIQDFCSAQVVQNEAVAKKGPPAALQDLCLTEPAVLVGLISTLAGSALPEDIASLADQLRRKGQDILYQNATARPQSA